MEIKEKNPSHVSVFLSSVCDSDTNSIPLQRCYWEIRLSYPLEEKYVDNLQGDQARKKQILPINPSLNNRSTSQQH